MDYVNDFSIKSAIIHILDTNGVEPVLNEYELELTEDTYKFIYKHIEKCFRDEELKYAVFNSERCIVKEIVQEYLRSDDKDILKLSKELARQLFGIMRGNASIPSSDLLVASLDTDIGPMIAMLKMDYVKNFTHEVNFIDEKIDIGIVPQAAGLPGSGQRIQKVAFIKHMSEDNTYDLLVLDKQKKSQLEDDEYGANYFVKNFLRCSIVLNERDMTKTFFKAAENFTRKNIKNDAVKAEKIRTAVKSKLKENDTVSIDSLSEDLFKENNLAKEDFKTFIKGQGLEDEVKVDRAWVDKKLKRVRLKVDKDIDIYINEECYNDNNKFEIQRNGDGSINMVIKHVMNYIEK